MAGLGICETGNILHERLGNLIAAIFLDADDCNIKTKL